MKPRRECNTKPLEHGCAQLGLQLRAPQIAQLHAHLDLLRKWGRRLNLTSVAREEMAARHALDSLSIIPFVHGETLLDIGSGGGFPGVPLAIACPHLRVTLIESRERRAAFLRHAIGELGLQNAGVVCARVEGARFAEKFDTLATRAFAPLGDALEVTRALHHAGARMLAMKGRHPRREIAALPPAWRARCAVEKVTVPFLHAERHVLIIQL